MNSWKTLQSITEELNDQFKFIMTTNPRSSQIAYEENQLPHFRSTNPDDSTQSISLLGLSKETEAELAYYDILYIGELDTIANNHEVLSKTVKRDALDLAYEIPCDAFYKEYEVLDEENPQHVYHFMYDSMPKVKTVEGYICFYELIQENVAVAEEKSHRREVYNVYCRGHLLKLWMRNSKGVEKIIKTQFYPNPDPEKILNTAAHTILALTEKAYKEIDNKLALREHNVHGIFNDF